MARKFTYDETKVKELRMKVVLACLEVMDGKDVQGWTQYKKDMVLKMSPRILPVLNEISGQGGNPLMIQVIRANGDKNDTTV